MPTPFPATQTSSFRSFCTTSSTHWCSPQALESDSTTPAADKERAAHALRTMERTFKCYILEDPQAVAIKEKINKLEADLAQVGVQDGECWVGLCPHGCTGRGGRMGSTSWRRSWRR